MIKFTDFVTEKKVDEEMGGTSTASVAGAGDDSSTVVVKKKKKEVDEVSSELLKRYADKATTQSAKDAMSGDKKRFDKAMKRARPIAKAQQKVADRKGDEIVKKHDPTYKKESVDFSLEEGYEKITPGVKNMAQRVHDAIKKGGYPKNRAHQMALDDSERALKQYHGKDWRKRLDVKESVDEALKTDTKIKMARDKMVRQMQKQGKSQADIDKACRMNFPSLYESVEVTEAAMSHELKVKWQKAGTELKKYGANKGGVDKKDFQDVGHMFDFTTRVNDPSQGYSSTQILNRIMGMDTDVRDKMMDIVTQTLGTKWRNSRPTSKEIFGKYMVEDTQVDEISRKTLSSYKRKASDQAGSLSTDPKTKEKRYSGVARASKKLDKKNRDMATAPFNDPKERGTKRDQYGNEVKNRAKYLAKQGMKEEEQLDEIVPALAAAAARVAAAAAAKKAATKAVQSAARSKVQAASQQRAKAAAASKANRDAIRSKMSNIRREETEQMDNETINEAAKTTYVLDKTTGHVKRVYNSPAMAEKLNPGEPTKVIKEEKDGSHSDGDIIHHPKHGEGVVVKSYGSGANVEWKKKPGVTSYHTDRTMDKTKNYGTHPMHRKPGGGSAQHSYYNKGEKYKSTMPKDHPLRKYLPKEEVEEAMTPKAKAKRFKDIAKAAKKVDKMNKKAERDAKRAIGRDKDYAVDMNEAVRDKKSYAAGQQAARSGKKYDTNPNPKGSQAHLDWSKGHNSARAGMNEGYDDAPKSSKVTSANNPEVSAYDDEFRKGKAGLSGFMNLQTWMSIHGISAKYQKELVNMLNKAGKGKQVKIPAKMKADYDAEYKKEGKPTRNLWIALN